MRSPVITIWQGFFGLFFGWDDSKIGPGVGNDVVALVAELAATGSGDIEGSEEDPLDLWADKVDLSTNKVGGGTSVLVFDTIPKTTFIDIAVLSAKIKKKYGLKNLRSKLTKRRLCRNKQ